MQGRIDLAWSSTFAGPVAAIEVYPAGTLRAHGIHERGYRDPGASRSRVRILDEARRRMDVDREVDAAAAAHTDALDAVLCLLAAHDFLSGDVIRPENESLARKEGWIWMKRPLQFREA
jgi:predicted nuclease with RNAse H fold